MSENEKPQDVDAHEPNGINGNAQNGDAEKQAAHHSKAEAAKDKITNKKEKLHDKNNPPGGYDATPIPCANSGFTVKITIHRADNLPMADLNTGSADPYVHATLTSAMPKRHKEDQDLTLRTPTVHKNTEPVWNYEWMVAGVPSSGFRLKCRLYDEDGSDHDDRLGNVTIHVNDIGLGWPGIKNESYVIQKKTMSKRAFLIRGCASLFDKNIHMNGNLWVSAEVIGESEKPHGRMYTVGKTSWIKHYSPMIGRLAGTKAPGSDKVAAADGESPKAEKYDFQANQYQLQGPVPAELYHRFVEFKPFVKGMFSKAGLRGRVLNKALHHQHARVYNFSNSTEYGDVKPRSEEAALQFLKMAHYDEGGRIFTYVLTTDGLLRFTETGKEFGIDMLSKHTMHSDVAIYIACSGEFFIRRLAHPEIPVDSPQQESHPNSDLPGGPPHAAPPKNPRSYELCIDNDSGTYRPKADLLPLLKGFLKGNFPGLHVVTHDCMDEKLVKMKKEQVERKRKEGDNIQVVQNSDDEISSSDESDLDEMAGGKRKKSGKQRAYDALEDPSQAFKDLIPGEKGRSDREARETAGDRAELGEGSSGV